MIVSSGGLWDAQAGFHVSGVTSGVRDNRVIGRHLVGGICPAREKARQSVCISNLHQIGVALSLYRSDYDGQEAMQGVPMTASQLGLPLLNAGFGVFIHAYIKNPQVLHCPDFWLDPNRSQTEKKQLVSSYVWDYTADEDTLP